MPNILKQTQGNYGGPNFYPLRMIMKEAGNSVILGCHYLIQKLRSGYRSRKQVKVNIIWLWVINLPPKPRNPPRNKAFFFGLINHWFPLPRLYEAFIFGGCTLEGGVGWPAMIWRTFTHYLGGVTPIGACSNVGHGLSFGADRAQCSGLRFGNVAMGDFCEFRFQNV